jgi:hypothetical protein
MPKHLKPSLVQTVFGISSRKAESLAHFSFVKSNKRLLLVDIQGGEYNLTDPEIAILDGIYNDDDRLLFFAGNLSNEASRNFFMAHKCSVFCNLLGLLLEKNMEDDV